MLHLANIHSLTDFQRNTRRHLLQLRKSGKPEVLTVNGTAEIVVQSAASYQKVLDELELLETLKGIRRGLEQAKRGKGRPMRAFLKQLAREHGTELDP